MIERPEYIEKLKRYKDKNLIKVITGIRRCGKTVLLFELYKKYLIETGIDEGHIICVNLENVKNEWLRSSKELYDYIVSKRIDSAKYYVMIDEIQYINSFEDILNSLKNEDFDVYVTGSNSKMLSGDISTALRGRSIEIKVFTLSFKEYYSYVGGDRYKAFNEYMLYGGFPAVATEEDTKFKTDYLEMLEETVATKDIIERNKIRNIQAFKETYNFLCSNIGSLVSAKKITDTLKTNAFKTITADTIGNYLEWLCQAFLFTKVYRYDIKGKSYLKTLNKYYATDMGLRNTKLNFRQIEPSHALENIIFTELLRRGYRVDIGKNREKEIDFVATDSEETSYIQVAYSILDSNKKEQELNSFKDIDDGYRKIIITMDNDPFTHLEKGYKKINAIDFLLDEVNI